jgi:pimeloyl-ACP methyl ester carboxylesterase
MVARVTVIRGASGQVTGRTPRRRSPTRKRTARAFRAVSLTIPVMILVAAATGCGGSDQRTGDSTASPTTTAQSTTTTSSVREVTAQVGGRVLTGHCNGTQQDLPAVVLDSGMAGGQQELANLEEQLSPRTVVCAYDRAGVGNSDPSSETPRPLSDLVADLDAFATAAEIRAPYVLAGQSAGATVVFMYAQAHPDKVAGFVSMNPVPPAKAYLRAVQKVETKAEYQDELAFYRGENDEQVNFDTSDRQLTDPLPPTMPYVIMFDEDCGGDTAFCRRVLPALTQTTKQLASVGKGGQFVAAKGAGHAIYHTNPELVLKTVEGVLNDAS